MQAKDPQKDLVEPAVKGTLTVLQSAKKAGVRRVVVTSSIAAVTDSPDPNHTYTDADWNTESSLSRNPYYYSKTLAEKAAWDFAKENQLDLVVVNPCLVVGPSHIKELNPSMSVVASLLNKGYPVVMDVAWAFVDVRDVARAHILAVQNPKANGRYLAANVTLTMVETLEKLAPLFPQYPRPTKSMTTSFGSGILRLASYTQPGQSGSWLRTNLGKRVNVDNSKIRNELDLKFIDIEQTLRDSVDDLITWGHLQELREKAGLSDEDTRKLGEQIKEATKSGGLPVSDHRCMLSSMPNTFTGAQFVAWLATHLHLARPKQALAYGNSLLARGLIISPQKHTHMLDKSDAYYRVSAT